MALSYKELHRDIRFDLTYSRYKLMARHQRSKQQSRGSRVGGETVSGLLYAEDFVSISETPDGLQKTSEEGTTNRVHYEVENGGEREDVRSCCMCRI